MTVAAGLVVTASEDGCAYGVDAADGTLRWKVTGARCVARTYPAIAGGRVFLYTRDRDLLALDAADGSTLWRRQGLGGEPGSFPQVAGDVVMCGRWRVHGVLADSGTNAWAPGPPHSVFPRFSPRHGNHAYVTTREFLDTGKLWELNVNTGRLRPLLSAMRGIDTSPVTGHGLVFTASGDGTELAIDPRNAAVHWQDRMGRRLRWTPGYRPSAPTVAGGRIWAAGPDCRVHARNARDGADHRTFGINAWSSPVPAGDLVCVMATDGAVYALADASPSPRWVLRTAAHGSDPAMVAPAVAAGVLYVGSPDRHLYAFEIARVPPGVHEAARGGW